MPMLMHEKVQNVSSSKFLSAIPDEVLLTIDEQAFSEEVFDIIEPALQQAGYTILEGDASTICVVAPDGVTHFDIILDLCA